MQDSNVYPKKAKHDVTEAATARGDGFSFFMRSHGKITVALRDMEAPKTATVTIKFFQEIGRRLWNWIVLRM